MHKSFDRGVALGLRHCKFLKPTFICDVFNVVCNACFLLF